MANKHVENLVNITIDKRNANQNHNKTNRLTDLENKLMVSNGEWNRWATRIYWRAWRNIAIIFLNYFLIALNGVYAIKNWMEREVGGGIGMGNACKSMADSCQYMAKTTTILKSN